MPIQEEITVNGLKVAVQKQDDKYYYLGGDITDAYTERLTAINIRDGDPLFNQREELLLKANYNLSVEFARIGHERAKIIEPIDSTHISDNGQNILDADTSVEQKVPFGDITKIPPYKRGQLSKYTQVAVSANKQTKTTEKSGAVKILMNIFVGLKPNEIDLTDVPTFDQAIDGLRKFNLITKDDHNIPADFMAELGYQRDLFATEGTGWKKSSPKVYDQIFDANKPHFKGNELSQALSMPEGPIKDEKLFEVVSDISKINNLKLLGTELEIKDLAVPRFGTAKLSQDVEKEIRARISPSLQYDEANPAKRDNLNHGFTVLKTIIMHHNLDEQSSMEILLRFLCGHSRSTAEHEFFVLKQSFEMVWTRILRQSSWNFGSNAVYEQELKAFSASYESNFTSIATSLEKLYSLSIKAASDKDPDTHMIKAYGLFKTHLENYVVRNYNDEVWYRILTRIDDSTSRMTAVQRASNSYKTWGMFIDAGDVLKNIKRAPTPTKDKKGLEPRFNRRNFSSRIMNVETDRSQKIKSSYPKGYGNYCLNCKFKGGNEKFKHTHHSSCPFYQSAPFLKKSPCGTCEGFHIGECLLKRYRASFNSSNKNRQTKPNNNNNNKSQKSKNSKEARKPQVFDLSTPEKAPVSS